MYKLYKMSSPGWIKQFADKFEAQSELYQWICGQCRAEEGITEISDIQHMLSTACGCEFEVEDGDEDFD